jgi:Bifunctional DNA primase/polymerase, N-terminal
VLPGVDFRGQGGYIVTPPSVHPTGVCYRWIIRDDLGTAPSWLVDLVGPERAVNGSKN